MFKKMKQAERSRLLRRGEREILLERFEREKMWVCLTWWSSCTSSLFHFVCFFLSFSCCWRQRIWVRQGVVREGFGSDKKLLEKDLGIWVQTSIWVREKIWVLRKDLGFIRMKSWDMGGMWGWGVCLKRYFILFFFEDLGNRKWIWVVWNPGF